ncbi:MAG: DUF2167 domain-containing protein [Bacteroidetes bacterium]|nr:DUF2167 domain-containing protein [Bacteroidota bacterium]
MKKIICLLAINFWFSSAYSQATHEDTVAMYQEVMNHYLDSINGTFKYQTGQITLDGGFATIDVPKGLRFLDAAQSKTVLVDLWGNPNANGIIGMLFPEKYTPLDENSWAFTISFDEMGYVEDDDAEDMDYAELLTTMKKETSESNTERIKEGYDKIELINWASTPFYDKDRKVLHWAKEFKFGEATDNTLNYDVRILGRKGVLSMNAVGKMSSLTEVKPVINYLLSSVKFTPGNQYSDYDSSVDEVAAWSIGGLVAGKVLAKVGLWALFAKYIKLIFIAVAAAVGGIWKWVKNRKDKNQDMDNNMPITKT